MDEETCNLIYLLHKKYQSEMDEHDIKTREHRAIEEENVELAKEHQKSIQINDALEETSHKCLEIDHLSPKECQSISNAINSWEEELNKYGGKFEKIPLLNNSIKKERQFIKDIRSLVKKHC